MYNSYYNVIDVYFRTGLERHWQKLPDHKTYESVEAVSLMGKSMIYNKNLFVQNTIFIYGNTVYICITYIIMIYKSC